MKLRFPEHKCGLYLTHNEHKDYYLTAEQWLDDRGGAYVDWPDEAERRKAIETNEVWTLQWYPKTPIGSYYLGAASLDRLMEFVAEHVARVGAKKGAG